MCRPIRPLDNGGSRLFLREGRRNHRREAQIARYESCNHCFGRALASALLFIRLGMRNMPESTCSPQQVLLALLCAAYNLFSYLTLCLIYTIV